MMDNNAPRFSCWQACPEVDLNEIPRYSLWPSRLLELEQWNCQERTPEDIEREYHFEKYGPMLELLRDNADINNAAELFTKVHGERDFICCYERQFRRLTGSEANTLKYSIFSHCIKRYLPAGAVVDIGAGIGDIALFLAVEFLKNEPLPIYALEKMPNAVKIMQLLAERQKVPLNTGFCDFNTEAITEAPVPPDALLYTSSSVYLQTRSTAEIVNSLKKLKPKVVLHFEPFTSFFDLNTIYGLLCHKYALKNRHNMHFDSDLFQLNGRSIDIIEQRPLLFGNNPFFPVSLIAWKPRY
ncbi:hypothetical protein LJB99_02985 [Deltaproteobacteria bacterium OttesenSCG-928-K17]|nr:hypothetical protein [Deltaproteobacteria bacterium OttesenSCG-928-K17]